MEEKSTSLWSLLYRWIPDIPAHYYWQAQMTDKLTFNLTFSLYFPLFLFSEWNYHNDKTSETETIQKTTKMVPKSTNQKKKLGTQSVHQIWWIKSVDQWFVCNNQLCSIRLNNFSNLIYGCIWWYTTNRNNLNYYENGAKVVQSKELGTQSVHLI